MDKLSTALNYFDKLAARVGRPDPVSGLAAATVGRIGGLPNLILSRHMLSNADPGVTDSRVSQYSDMESEALRDVVVRTDGSNFLDDYLYKDDPDKANPRKKKKWYQRVGGRVWHNPNTSLPMKALATAMSPMNYLSHTLQRASHYDPTTNAVNNYGNEPAVLEHELGHAIDFNDLYGLGVKPKDTLLKRIPKQLAHDAYILSANIPGVNLWHEAQANRRSSQVNDRLHAGGQITPEDYEERRLRRTEVLPAGYGSYLGGNIPFVGPLLSAPGTLLGKSLGLATTASRRDDQEREKSDKRRKKQHKQAAATGPAPSMFQESQRGMFQGAAIGGLGGMALTLPDLLASGDDYDDELAQKRLLRRMAIGATGAAAIGGILPLLKKHLAAQSPTMPPFSTPKLASAMQYFESLK